MVSAKHRSFFSQVFFWLCIVALVPLLIMSIQGYHCSRQAVIDRAENHLISVIEARNTMFNRWMDERKSDIAFLSVMFSIENDDEKEEIKPDAGVLELRNLRLLNRIKEENPSFETIYLYDSDWKKILESDPAAHPEKSLLNRSFAESLEKSENTVIIGEAHLHRDGKIGAHAGYRAVDGSGRTLGYILINLNLSSTIDPILLDRAGLGQSGKVYLHFPRENKYYLPTEPSQHDLVPVRESRMMKNLLEGEHEISEYKDYKGNGVLGIISRINDLGADLVVEIDQSEAFEWVRILGLRALVTGLLTLIVIIFIALNISRNLTRPLKKLLYVSQKVSEGQHAQRVELIGASEIREVAGSFNKMLDDLLESHRRVVRMESLAAVGETSSAIVHELRSPLSSIKINFQAFRSKLDEDENFIEVTSITQRQIERLERMLSSLLGYAKPLELKVSSFNIESLITDVRETVSAELERNSCKLIVENHLEGKFLAADSEQLRIALSNLVLNAIQTSPEGSEIELQIGLLNADRDVVKISVADRGQGINEENLNKLFKPFFSTKRDGTGLGLANVKKIAEYHGGEVEIQKREDKGTVFSLIIPSKDIG